MDRALEPGERLDRNMHVEAGPGGRRLPLNLLDALRAFEASETLRRALGGALVDAYAGLKRQEWASCTRHLTEWERDAALDC